MTSRVSWSVDGIEPSVRERAEAAARRAGLSLSQWLDAAVGGPAAAERETREIAEIHRRLDSIARQVETLTRPAERPRNDPALARQLNDAISRLDARLSHLAAPGEIAPQQVPPLAPGDFSIAEIVARRNELDGLAQQAAPPQPDMSGLERQLAAITSEIATLHRPDDGLEQSIRDFRTELAEIRRAITEALPRQAIESLETEIRALGQRIDETRQNGADGAMLAGIEQALSDIRGQLQTLKPAEQLAGFDQAIRNLGDKLDTILRASSDPATLRQLEDAIAALRAIVASVASNDALNMLAGHVQALSQKVDQLAQSGSGDILAALEQRITVLTAALESRERPPAPDSSHFDDAVRTISDRLDRLQVGGGDSAAAFSHVEQRVQLLLERLEMAEARGSNLGRVEEGLAEILRHLEHQRTEAARAPEPVREIDGAFAEAIRRELSDIRFSQSETNRHTQDSLEVVHSTLGHVVDRLAQIESDLRAVRSAPASAPRAEAVPPPVPRPELPNPAASQPPVPRAPAAPAPAAAPTPAASMADAPALAPTLADSLVPPAPSEAEPKAAEAAPVPTPARPAPAARNPIDPTLPPDFPLEPGTRPQAQRGSPSERIAASESVLGEIAAAPRELIGPSNFIQAARRAAQAAAAAPQASTGGKPNRVTALSDAARNAAKAAGGGESTTSSKIRALLVGVSIVVIVLGTVKMGMNLLASRDAGNPPTAESSAGTPMALPVPGDGEPHSDAAPLTAPSITSPTPLDRQSSMSAPAPVPVAPPADMAAPAAPTPPSPDVTGSVNAAPERISVTIPPFPAPKAKPIAVPAGEALPETIGSAVLRNAAMKGDPGAAYEIGVRYAEGRGVPANFELAAKWYERAAQGGIVPAIFRLGALHEKGLGTKKDLDAARRYYMEAAEHGNAKAMHNLAVLDADGGGNPNYTSAAHWFRKAAARGIADSQFNLGILYARGIGVEQNLAESFKWFSLAAAQGDADAARKRDDIAKRLDPQSLAAARLAIQTFAAEPQPDEALATGAPAGGWDAAPARTSAAKPGARPAAGKTASRNSAAH